MKHFALNIFVVLLMVSSVALVGCGNAKLDRINVTVTIEPMRYFVEQIADSLVSVEVMVPQGSSPETYEPTPQQMVSLSDSKAYLQTGGLGFELSWMDKLVQNVPSIKVYDTSKGIDLIASHSSDKHHGSTDPHIWTSPRNVKVIAENICNALIEIDSIHADEYRRNLDRFIVRIENVDRQIHASLKDKTSRSFLIYHPTLTYYAHDYGLMQYVVEIDGKKPSPQQLRSLIDVCRNEKISTIFLQEEFNTRNIDLISRETKTKPHRINPLAYDWEKEMLNITNILANE